MTKPKHAPEPWKLTNPEGEIFDDRNNEIFIIDGNGDCYIGLTYKKLDAQRIIDCVNACKGINPEAVPEMLEALKDITEGNRPERDEWGDFTPQAIAKRAISKAENKD